MSRRVVCKWYAVCPLKRFYERQMVEKKWIEKYCRGDYFKCARYTLEENGVYHPDTMLPDGTINEELGCAER